MLKNLTTLNKGKQLSSKEIEKQLEITRDKYLEELDKLRNKYVTRFIELSSAYENCI